MFLLCHKHNRRFYFRDRASDFLKAMVRRIVDSQTIGQYTAFGDCYMSATSIHEFAGLNIAGVFGGLVVWFEPEFTWSFLDETVFGPCVRHISHAVKSNRVVQSFRLTQADHSVGIICSSMMVRYQRRTKIWQDTHHRMALPIRYFTIVIGKVDAIR